jgi:tRNA (mo5U34)-methyltransferase
MAVHRRTRRTLHNPELGDAGNSPPFHVASGADPEVFAKDVAAREWFHRFEFDNGVVAHGVDPSHFKTQYLGLPESFDGLTVLDIGTYEGHYAFEAARRGAADVLAADHWVWTWPGSTARSNFEFVREHLALPVRDVVLRVEDLTPEAVGGTYDVVLFLGVLYHAPDPLGYLRRVHAVTRQYALVETVVDLLDVDRPALAYYPGAYLNGDASNHFGPNLHALHGLLYDAGFSRVEDVGIWRFHEIEVTRQERLPRGDPRSGRAVVRAWR